MEQAIEARMMVKPIITQTLFGYLGMCTPVHGPVEWSRPGEQSSPGISADNYRVLEIVGHADSTLRRMHRGANGREGPQLR